ncbi:hypothetical protein [Ochrobactrum sp. BTU1]|uniref:hypothetical protein n=1 Tax=Ochrobactrum sp. BTU1 TaxID=2840456 RepID=UPI001C047965|nr:hypothetical protein KMS41_11720 [Ochrobactrum sp. BTU1]
MHIRKFSSIDIVLPLGAFLVSFVVFILRRPDIITNPNFWAEDGVVWYKQAYSNGPISLLWPQDGYYQTVSKLTGLISLFFPVAYAPLLFNIVSIAFRSILVSFILSSRMNYFSWKGRILVCCFIVLMPGLSEVHANITNTHWYLSMWLVCIIICNKPQTNIWFCHDIFVTCLAGLSGPFIIFIAPLVCMRAWFDADYRRYLFSGKGLLFAGVFTTILLVQVVTILILGQSARVSAPLGFSFDILTSILSARIFLGAFLSEVQIHWLFDQHVLNTLISILGVLSLIYAFFKLTWQFKCVILFSFLMIFTALMKPMINATEPQLQFLNNVGGRYFVITSIAWFTILISVGSDLLSRLNNTTKIIATTVSMAAIVALIAPNFRMPPLRDTMWSIQASEFAKLPAGTEYTFNINPEGWTMKLVR